MRAMAGRCFGCGSNAHVRRDCPMGEVQCGYCKRRNHKEAVCQDRYMGRERDGGLRNPRRGQRVAATVTEDLFSLFSNETPPPPSAPAPASVAATSANVDMQAMMEEYQKRNAELQTLLAQVQPAPAQPPF